MTGALYATGRFCARLHWPVIAVWVVVAVALGIAAASAGSQYSDNLSLPGTDSTKAQDLLIESLPGQAYGSNPLVLKAGEGKLTDPSNSKAIDATVKRLDAGADVRETISPLGADGAGALSKDERIGYISVTLRESPGELTVDEANQVIARAEPARAAGIEVEAGGYLGQAVSQTDTESSEVVGIAAAVIILLFAFGTVTAMGLPIVTALLGLASALSLITLLGHVVDVPSVAPTLGTMIGIGVGIDYALFIVTRHKSQLRDGMEMRESIARATATAGGAVVFAGGTVVIALCSLVAANIPIVGAMGTSAAVVVVIAVVAATTLLPALLGALGPRIDSLRVKLGRTHPDDHRPHGWRRWARGVAARPWRSLVASVVALAVVATPVLQLELGSSDSGELPTDTTARKAYDLIAAGFGPGANGPLLVGVQLGGKAPQSQPAAPSGERGGSSGAGSSGAGSSGAGSSQATASGGGPAPTTAQVDPRLGKLMSAVAATPDVATLTPPKVTGDGKTAVFTAVPKTSPTATRTEDLVRQLRDSTIPSATQGTGLSAYVGGSTAGYIDLADRIADKLPQMIALVVALSFLLLLVAFRSLVLPAKAAVANLLSVAAAYGVVTFVFQEGHGASLIGLDGAVPIASFVPLLMFTILFGLSMDYEVFLLSQIQEHYGESRDTHRAIVDGLASTGRVITSAALIMVCVFASFILSGDAVVKQFGVGLAVAIAIDATIVRCLFVPAAMTLLGRWCWWLPGWLDRILPRLSIEGEEFFARRAATEPGATPAPATHGP